jgi:hypothetical protein
VYVPIFESDSFRRGLGERLTEAVIREIEQTTPYDVVSDPNADSVLTGRIVSDRKRVVAEDINDLPRDVAIDLVVQVTWYDRRSNRVLQEDSFAVAPLSYFAAQSADFVAEGGPSLASSQQEAIERLAREIVHPMEPRW